MQGRGTRERASAGRGGTEVLIIKACSIGVAPPSPPPPCWLFQVAHPPSIHPQRRGHGICAWGVQQCGLGPDSFWTWSPMLCAWRADVSAARQGRASRVAQDGCMRRREWGRRGASHQGARAPPKAQRGHASAGEAGPCQNSLPWPPLAGFPSGWESGMPRDETRGALQGGGPGCSGAMAWIWAWIWAWMDHDNGVFPSRGTRQG